MPAAARQPTKASAAPEAEATTTLLLERKHRARSKCKILGALAMIEGERCKIDVSLEGIRSGHL